jgi:hypothetical protein
MDWNHIWKKKCLRFLAIVPGFVLFAFVSMAHGETLFYNLSQTGTGQGTLSNTYFKAQKFGTDGFMYTLDSVTVRLRAHTQGNLFVRIYDDAGDLPNSAVGSMKVSSVVGSTYENYILKPQNTISLKELSNYWVVVGIDSGPGYYDWNYTVSNVGSGVGFSSRWAYSTNAGATWVGIDGEPFMMEVSATRAAPEDQANNLTFSSVAQSQMTVSWTRGDGDDVLIVAHQGSAVDSNPVDGADYTASPTFKSGSQIGTGNYVVYKGTGTSVAVTGLTASATYHFRAYEYNDAGGGPTYNTATATGNPNSRTTLSLTAQVDLTGPATLTAGAVSSAFTLTSQDGTGNPSNVTADTKFDLSSNSPGTKVFYSNAAGTNVITQTTIPNGTSSITFYYKDSNKGTPAVTATWNSGGTNLGSDTLPVTVNLATTTLATSSSVAASFKNFKVTVTKIEMNNGTGWAEIFSGASELDLVNPGTFPGVSNVVLPFGTYSRMRVTFENSLPITGTLTYNGTAYYTTSATYGGASNAADNPSTDAGDQTVYTFRIEEWGALNADVVRVFDIGPITVDAETDYQPTLRFTISKTFLFKGSAGVSSTYYFTLSTPTVSLVEP